MSFADSREGHPGDGGPVSWSGLASPPKSFHHHDVRHVLSIHKDIGEGAAVDIVAVGDDADRGISQ